MRTIRISLCLTAVLAAGWSSDATAQSPRGKTSTQHERIARANWQPTRPQATDQRAEAPIRRVDHRVPVKTITNKPAADKGTPIKGLPSLPASAQISVIEPPITAAPLEAAPLDGQILPPHYDGACDALPPGTCDCGDTACDGGCDSIGCDPLGCDGACGGENCSCCGELCSPEAWRPCVTICLPQDGWASFEYLSWWQDGMYVPPLITTNVSNNVPQQEAGVLTSPTTRVLFGGPNMLDDQFDGGRLRFGLWLDRCHTWGVGAEYFQIGNESESVSLTSTGDPILARPFFNTQTGVEDSELVAYPDVISGTVSARVDSELVGAGVNFRYLRCCDQGCSKWLFCGCPEHFCSRSEALLGWRYLQLDEGIAVRENLTTGDGTFDILDSFDTRNQFNGVDIGWLYRRTRGYWTFDSLIRLAVGNTRQTVTIAGRTTINSQLNDPPQQTLPGGLLAQTSNIGTYRDDQFAVVPEFNANIGYQLTDHWRVMLGYTFIYWSNVVRPGDQIDRDVNPELLPPPVDPITGAQRPEFAFDTTDYWVQGINLGLEYRW